MSLLAAAVRRAGAADAGAIAGVHRAAWLEAYQGLIPHRRLSRMLARRHEGWWMRAIRAGAPILVLDLGGETIGYATLGRNRAANRLGVAGEIYELYLEPAHQGLGLGAELFSSARRFLADLGLDGMALWALEDNERALSFYRRRGGVEIARDIETFDGTALGKIAFRWP